MLWEHRAGTTNSAGDVGLDTTFKGRGSVTEPWSVAGWSHPEFEEQDTVLNRGVGMGECGASDLTWSKVGQEETANPPPSTLPFSFLAFVKITRRSFFGIVFNHISRGSKLHEGGNCDWLGHYFFSGARTSTGTVFRANICELQKSLNVDGGISWNEIRILSHPREVTGGRNATL